MKKIINVLLFCAGVIIVTSGYLLIDTLIIIIVSKALDLSEIISLIILIVAGGALFYFVFMIYLAISLITTRIIPLTARYAGLTMSLISYLAYRIYCMITIYNSQVAGALKLSMLCLQACLVVVVILSNVMLFVEAKTSLENY